MTRSPSPTTSPSTHVANCRTVTVTVGSFWPAYATHFNGSGVKVTNPRRRGKSKRTRTPWGIRHSLTYRPGGTTIRTELNARPHLEGELVRIGQDVPVVPRNETISTMNNLMRVDVYSNAFGEIVCVHRSRFGRDGALSRLGETVVQAVPRLHERWLARSPRDANELPRTTLDRNHAATHTDSEFVPRHFGDFIGECGHSIDHAKRRGFAERKQQIANDRPIGQCVRFVRDRAFDSQIVLDFCGVIGDNRTIP